MQRRTFVKAAFGAALAGPISSMAETANRSPRCSNIIYLMTDDHSPIPFEKERIAQSRPFGFNGDGYVHTPEIDKLARDGIIFTRAYVSSTVCSPSRYSTLTGRYPSRCRGPHFLQQHPAGTVTRPENNTELEEDRPTLPRLLQRAGYRTGFVGKSHVIDHHLLDRDQWQAHGLMTYKMNDDPRDPEVAKAMAHNHRYWVSRVKQYGFDFADAVYAANFRELWNASLNVHNVEWKTRPALEFIEQSGDKPFFLYFSETLPHGPAPWIRQDGKYVHGLDSNPGFSGEGYVEQEYEFMPDRETIKAEITKQGKDPDHAWLRWVDHAVGAIVQKLKETGQYENTLIVITSDHGNYNYQKSTLYEGGVKIPLLMHWPAGIKPSSVYDELVQNIDFAPTFLDLAGVKLDSSMELDGVSLKRVLEGDKKPVHEHLFFEIGYARGVMTKDWKYIAVRYDDPVYRRIERGLPFDGWEGRKLDLPYYVRNQHLGYHATLHNPNYFDQDQLYDLNSDPNEKNNLFDVCPDKAEKMKAVLGRYLRSFSGQPFGEFTQ
jgi:arylsulfatase A-like enzyme